MMLPRPKKPQKETDVVEVKNLMFITRSHNCRSSLNFNLGGYLVCFYHERLKSQLRPLESLTD